MVALMLRVCVCVLACYDGWCVGMDDCHQVLGFGFWVGCLFVGFILVLCGLVLAVVGL